MINKFTLGAATLALMLAGATDAKTLRMATNAPQESVWAKQIQALVDNVAAADVGLDIEVFWNGQLGDLGETFKQTIMGRTDMWAGTVPFIASVAPEIDVTGIPFIFDNDEQAKCVIPQLEEPYRQVIGDKFRLLHIAPISTQDFNAKHEVRVPADTRGLRVRTAPTAGAITYYRAAGAVPTPMSPFEAPAALQTGLIDAVDNEATLVVLTGMHKNLPYHTRLSTVHVLAGYVMSPRAWAGLTPEQQTAVQAAADKLDFSADFDAVEAFDAQLLEKAQAEGVTVTRITPEEREEWRQLGLSVRDEVLGQIRGDTASIMAAIDAAKASCK